MLVSKLNFKSYFHEKQKRNSEINLSCSPVTTTLFLKSPSYLFYILCKSLKKKQIIIIFSVQYMPSASLTKFWPENNKENPITVLYLISLFELGYLEFCQRIDSTRFPLYLPHLAPSFKFSILETACLVKGHQHF